MKILTIWDPWASFMARGWKRYETRGWRTSYRGLIALHAAKTTRCLKDTDEILLRAGITEPFPASGEGWNLGCILAIARLVDCVPTVTSNVSKQERALGDYSEGRFAWKFEDLRRIKPLPLKGLQGLKDLPAEVEPHIEYLPEVAHA
jgi:hypothetical protein